MILFFDLLLALFPLLLAVVCLLVLKVSSLKTAVYTYLSVVVITVLPLRFQTSADHITAGTIKGVLLSVIVIYVVFFGLFLYNLLRQGGALDQISVTFSQMSSSPVEQAILISAALGPFLEATSGFGVGVVIAAPIYLSLGFEPKKAALLALLTQIAVPWGGLAIGTVVNSELTEVPLQTLGIASALVSIPLFYFYTAVVVAVAGGWRAVRQYAGLIVFIGSTLSLSTLAANMFISTELTGAMGGLITAICLIGYWRLQSRRKRGWKEAAASEQALSTRTLYRSLLPYAVLIGFFIISHLIPRFQAFFQSFLVWELPAYDFRLEVLYSPGFALLLASLAAVGVYRLSWKKVRSCFFATIKQAYPVIVSTVGFIAMSSVMEEAGMIDLITTNAAAFFGSAFLAVSPLIGALGGFLSGSNTASNAMFAQFQHSMAHKLHEPEMLLATSQNVSASNVTMSSPSRVALVASITGNSGKEGELLRKMLLVSIGALVITILGILAWSVFV
ncbi:L-lactate permease [Bacillus piscicola]|uniref:L-lactate permease n=1 Tax=Bacillus piscicola TaxID=1632684 RepID=UPI001F09D3C3|nr:L-lactate permease [Bacillus piscicola]